MRAFKSKLAQAILKAAFFDRALTRAIREGKPFEFEGRTYRCVLVSKD